jgi:hypothetical protein
MITYSHRIHRHPNAGRLGRLRGDRATAQALTIPIGTSHRRPAKKPPVETFAAAMGLEQTEISRDERVFVPAI